MSNPDIHINTHYIHINTHSPEATAVHLQEWMSPRYPFLP